MSRSIQKTKVLLLGVILFVAIGIYSSVQFLRSSLAPTTGELQLPILESPVNITRDRFGIPHIEAANKLDALRALGFTMASERLFQLEISRRLTNGRLSEVLGESTLEFDKLYRSLLLRPTAERMIAHEKANGTFDETLWTEMEAYFEGVNYYAAHFPLPYEFTLLQFKPEPFSPLDAYVMTGHMAFSFATALTADPLMTELASLLPEEKFHELRNEVPDTAVKISQTRPSEKLHTSVALDLPKGFAFFEGSNAWLLDRRLSKSAENIFANDPHIAYSLPAVWFEAHLKAPDFEIYGHYLPLIPFAVLGHNHDKAWGFTMTLTDDMDLYRETLDRQNKTAIFKNQEEPYKETLEEILVKGEKEPVRLSIIETSHGPVLDYVLQKDLALKWSFHRVENNTMKALQKMNDSKDIKEFEEALKFATAPGLNVMYSDKKNIAWWMFGDIALKANPNSDLVLDGSSGEDEYVRYLNWDEKPHSVNPTEGIIVSANARPQGLRKDIRGDWQSADRYETILESLQAQKKWSAEETMALQVANKNHMTKKIMAVLLSALQAGNTHLHTEAYNSLSQWNLENLDNSKAPTFYSLWLNEIVKLLLEEVPEDLQVAYLKTPYAWMFLERTLLNPQANWWTGKNQVHLINKAFAKMLLHPDAHKTWSKVHTLEYVHPLGRIKPLNYIFNLGPYGISGAYNDINNQKMSRLGDGFQVVAGPSTRRVIDFKDTAHSWGINPVGNSGHMLSSHYKDQVGLFINSKHRPQLLNIEDVEKENTGVLKLVP